MAKFREVHNEDVFSDEGESNKRCKMSLQEHEAPKE